MSWRSGLFVACLAGLIAPAGAEEPLRWPANAFDSSGVFARGWALLSDDGIRFTPNRSTSDSGPPNDPFETRSLDQLRSISWPHVRYAPAAEEIDSLILSAWGDLTPGRILTLDEKTALVSLGAGEPVSVPRAALAGVALRPGRQLEFAADFSDPSVPRSREFAQPLPAGEAIVRVASEENAASGQIVSLRFERGEIALKCERLPPGGDSKTLRWLASGNATSWRQERPPVTRGEATVRLVWDAETVTIDVDGVRVASGEIKLGAATGLVVAPFIADASVYRRAAALAPLTRDVADRDLLQLDDGETLCGTIIALRNGRWRIVTEFGEASAPAAKTAAVLFRRHEPAPLPPVETLYEVPLRLSHDWGDFTFDDHRPRALGSLEKIDRAGVHLRHPLYGRFTVPLAQTAGLQQIGRPALRSDDAPKSSR